MTSAGRIYVAVSESDLNKVLARFPEAQTHYAHGCFLVSRRLPLGFGATLVAVPSQQGHELLIAVPFDQIRGDRTGGFAGTIAKTFWGMISGQVQKMADNELRKQGLPPETVIIQQTTLQDGSKGGLIRISLPHVNAWLRRQNQPLRVQIARLHFTPQHVHADLDALV